MATVQANSQEFAYRPLIEQSYEIRLLQFINHCEDDSDEMRCELVHVAFQHDEAQSASSTPGTRRDGTSPGWGKFIALSYVWGSAKWPTRHIYLADHKFDATLNLHHALRQVRRMLQQRPDLPQRIWADAVCIDQSNIQERNKQVPRMRHIYSQASHVFCCLSPEWSIAEGSATMAREVRLDPSTWFLKHFNGDEYKHKEGRVLLRYHFDSAEHSHVAEWVPWVDAFANPYWNRLWIVQEIALASNEILILAGDDSMPWEVFASAAAVFRNLPYATRDNISSFIAASRRGLMPYAANVDKIVDISRQFAQHGGSDTYAEPSWVIRTAGKSQAHNTRDKVYGLLSLLAPDLADRVHVDYSKSVASVWTEFASAVVQSSGDLNILPLCAQPDQNKARGVPSWVPDLNNGNAPTPFRARCEGLPWSAEMTPARADGIALIARGLYFDRIDGVGAIRHDFDRLFMNSGTEKAMIQPRGQDGRVRSTAVPSGYLSLMTALLPTLNARGEDSRPSIATIPPLRWLRKHQQTSRNISRVLRFLEMNADFKLPDGFSVGETIEHFDLSIEGIEAMPTASDKSYRHNHYLNVTDRIDSALNYRRLATTIEGRIALVPCDARPGDCIYAIPRFDGRGLLRQHGTSWRWIGSCYIDGLMRVEDIAWRRADTEELRII